MDLGLKGKRAIVTGTTAGIGEGIARARAREGVRVAINGRSDRRGRAVTPSRKARPEMLQNLSPQLISRIGRVEDNGDAAAYLASAGADFINGIHLRVDGGASPSLS